MIFIMRFMIQNEAETELREVLNDKKNFKIFISRRSDIFCWNAGISFCVVVVVNMYVSILGRHHCTPKCSMMPMLAKD